MVLTQANDVFQYGAGKLLGRRPSVPSVSPGKTWEGFAGGLVATTRGEPERLSAFKGGVVRLAERHREAAVVPIFLYGLGKALPKGSLVLVPFFCDVFVGEPLAWSGDRRRFLSAVDHTIRGLAAIGQFPARE